MTLKTDYFDGASGFTAKMADVFAAGEAFIATNYAAIQTALQTAAGKGQKDFSLILPTSFETVNLRLNGIHLSTFFNGIIQAFGDEGIYTYEVALSLDTSDSLITNVIFNFTF